MTTQDYIDEITDPPTPVVGRKKTYAKAAGFFVKNHAGEITSMIVPPTTENDIPLGGGGQNSGKWIKKTWSEYLVILRNSIDSLYDAAGAAATVASNLSTHAGLTGTAAHGLGTAGTHAASDFLASTSFSGLAKLTVGSSAPANPGAGDLWVDTSA